MVNRRKIKSSRILLHENSFVARENNIFNIYRQRKQKREEKLEEIQKAINLKSPDTLPVIDDVFDFLSTYHSEDLQKFLVEPEPEPVKKLTRNQRRRANKKRKK